MNQYRLSLIHNLTDEDVEAFEKWLDEYFKKKNKK